MNAPIDIVISIIERMKKEYESDMELARGEDLTFTFIQGKVEAMEELKDQLEGFKKLFS